MAALLPDSARRLRILDTLFARMRSIAYVLEPDGRFVEANAGALQVLGVGAGELRRCTLDALASSSQDAARLRLDLEEVVRERRPVHRTLLLGTRSPAVIHDHELTPIMDGDELLGVLGIARELPAATTTDERARRILESISDAFFSLDRDFRFSYLNETAQRFLRRDDLVGKNIWEEFPAARNTEFQRAYEHAMHRGERVDFVARYPAPLDRWYEVRAYPSPEGVSVFFQDITERRHAENEHERQRAQLELVVRGADVGVWYCPLPFDELIWDAKVKEHFHLPPDARVTIDTFYERLHPDDRERTRLAIQKSMDAREAYDIDYRTVSPDGQRTKWIRALGSTYYDDDGKAIRFDGVTSDVSERKLSELAVRASEERYRLATRATNDVIWDWQLASSTVRWNEALAEHYGHAVASSDSAFWLGNIHPDDRSRVSDSIHAVIDDPSREHWQNEYRFARADGTYADVLDRGFVHRDEAGKGIRMIGAMQNLTDRKRVERDRERLLEAERSARSELERQSRMKDEFLTTLSHELRTPLNAILGWSQLLASRHRDQPQLLEALEVVTRNARLQVRLIDDLLDVSRMLSGKLQLETQLVPLLGIVWAAAEATRPLAEAKGIRIHVLHEGSEAMETRGDAGRLQQVFGNLLGNAVKFTLPGGEVNVTVTATEQAVEVEVADDGEGIHPDFLPFVFERFRQADGSITRKHGGLGLGLSIVKEVVELHGGQVTASSPGVGMGTTMTVRLPRVLGGARPRGPTETPGADVRGLRVLVVDNELDALDLCRSILEGAGADVVTASSAADGFAALGAEGSFDVLVTDIGMPEEDGYAFLDRVRAASRARGIPAIALTAYARAEDRGRALAAGFHEHVAKPVEPSALRAAIATAAGRAS